MPVIDNHKKVSISFGELIRALLWCIILSALLVLKYIFPGNQFVTTYFKGLYSFLSIIVFLFFVWRVEVFIAKKRKKATKGAPKKGP